MKPIKPSPLGPRCLASPWRPSDDILAGPNQRSSIANHPTTSCVSNHHRPPRQPTPSCCSVASMYDLYFVSSDKNRFESRYNTSPSQSVYALSTTLHQHWPSPLPSSFAPQSTIHTNICNYVTNHGTRIQAQRPQQPRLEAGREERGGG